MDEEKKQLDETFKPVRRTILKFALHLLAKPPLPLESIANTITPEKEASLAEEFGITELMAAYVIKLGQARKLNLELFFGEPNLEPKDLIEKTCKLVEAECAVVALDKEHNFMGRFWGVLTHAGYVNSPLGKLNKAIKDKYGATQEQLCEVPNRVFDNTSDALKYAHQEESNIIDQNTKDLSAEERSLVKDFIFVSNCNDESISKLFNKLAHTHYSAFVAPETPSREVVSKMKELKDVISKLDISDEKQKIGIKIAEKTFKSLIKINEDAIKRKYLKDEQDNPYISSEQLVQRVFGTSFVDIVTDSSNENGKDKAR